MEKDLGWNSFKNGFWFIGNNQIFALFYLRHFIWFEFESWLVVGGGAVNFWISTKVEIFGFLNGLFIWVWKLGVVGGWVGGVPSNFIVNQSPNLWIFGLRLLIWTLVLTTIHIISHFTVTEMSVKMKHCVLLKMFFSIKLVSII